MIRCEVIDQVDYTFEYEDERKPEIKGLEHGSDK